MNLFIDSQEIPGIFKLIFDKFNNFFQGKIGFFKIFRKLFSP